MPYYHCRKCHHEFERIPYEKENVICDWCGADRPMILEEKTPLEKMAENADKLLDKLIKEGKK
jgi:DNA-directed RNA polymerase subunit RPC12/RpoP